MSYAVLIIEDEAALAKNITTYLTRCGYDVRVAGTAEEGLALLDSFKPDAILLDIRLPGMNGLEALTRIRNVDRKIRIIMMTGHGTVELAVEAMKAGAYDFLTKPISLTKLKLLLEKTLGEERRDNALDYYRRKVGEGAGIDRLIGESPPMIALKQKITQVLEAEARLNDADVPAVLILGETGTGKELVARALHYDGPRRDKPFVEINCASIPPQLLESELFGHERGAFTDARERKLGLVETADGGTLFLDEIGDMDLTLQAKLLKLLEEKVVRRVGSLRDQRVNLRIVAATHRPLEELVQQGKFRSDLYFRLHIVQFQLPPLRERGNDVLLLARQLLAVHGARYAKPHLVFSRSAEQRLLAHGWPGNVRELRNVVEQAVLLSNGQQIDAEQLRLSATLSVPSDEGALRAVAGELPEDGVSLEDVERELLVKALQRTGWNITQAARLLGLSRDTLRYRIEKFRLVDQRSS